MSDLNKDFDAFKASCSPVLGLFSETAVTCGICSAWISISQSDQAVYSHFQWHNIHYQNHAMFAPHWHSVETGQVQGLPDSSAWDKTFG